MSDNEFIIKFIEGITNDIRRISDKIDVYQDRYSDSISKASSDRQELRSTIQSLESVVKELETRIEGLEFRVEEVSTERETGTYNKKGFLALLLGASFAGAAFEYGKINYQKFVDKFIPFLGE